MKIALFVGQMGRGGVTTRILELGAFLMGAGHAVTVVACAQGVWWPRLAQAGLPGVLLPPGKWESAVSHSRRVADHFVAGGYDVLFVFIGQGARPAQSGLHRLPDRIAAVPVLCNDLPRVYNDARLNQRAWNAAVAVSSKVQQTAAALFPQKPIVCILNGVRIPSPGALSQRLAWKLPLRLLYVGTLHDAPKGVLRLPAILAGCRAQGRPVRLTVTRVCPAHRQPDGCGVLAGFQRGSHGAGVAAFLCGSDGLAVSGVDRTNCARRVSAGRAARGGAPRDMRRVSPSRLPAWKATEPV